ncbi:MAG: 4'-phosphopantetheinyl transferase superfamily protein [Rhodococcus sp.]|nr:4'-phosphopantetheinyl transferase superfamily protein [Rhodococcus sp. (in: high G+C Gram-positive bacteria)]
MIERILIPGVSSAELFEDPPGLLPHPGEQHLVAKAVEKRRREFAGARHCARVAMEKLGVPGGPILKGEKGEPLWPTGITGSLAHCDGYRAAVLGHTMAVRSVGIDAEPHAALPDGVLNSVSIEAERTWLSSASADVHWDRVLFCAKEATYKAWFPLTKRWLGFEDAHITFTRDAGSTDVQIGSFQSELLISGETVSGPPLSSFEGRWMVSGGLIVTAITVQ